MVVQVAGDDAATIPDDLDDETIGAYVDRNLVTHGPIREPDLPSGAPITDGGSDTVQYTLAEKLWSDDFARGLADSDVPFDELRGNIDDLHDVGRLDGTTTLSVRNEGVPATVRYAEDGRAYLDRAIAEEAPDLLDEYGIDSLDEASSLSDAQLTNLKADLGEEVIAPRIARQKGYEVIDPPFDFGSDQAGFDVVARDTETGDIVIIEAKYFTENTGTKTITKNGWLSNPDKGRQLSDRWISNTIQDLESRALENGNTEQLQFVNMLKTANKRSELAAVQDRPVDGATVDGSLTGSDVTADGVDILKLGEVLNE